MATTDTIELRVYAKTVMARQVTKLTRYRQKRDFAKTAEPSGKSLVAVAEHLRYVIQKHAASHLHYDLRLELHGVFKSWAVTKGPSVDPADKRLAVEVEDHPLDYGDFEGTIPQGEYGGGTVQLWDRGFWAPEGAKSPQAALKDGDLKFVLAGHRLQGSWVLVRIKHNRGRDSHTNWLLIKHKDDYAQVGGTDALLAMDRSVASGRTMAQITRGSGKTPQPFMLAARDRQKADAVWHSNRAAAVARAAKRVSAPATGLVPTVRSVKSVAAPKAGLQTRRLSSVPTFIEPQLCKLVDRPPTQDGWGHEIKLDGYRVQVRVVKREVSIRTRSGLDWTTKFRALADLMKGLPMCIIDGEIVALDADDAPNFAALQAALSANRSQDLVLYAFDLLVEDGNDLRAAPLSARKTRLRQLLKRAKLIDTVRFVDHVESNGEAVLASACKMQLEGIVSKKLDAPYVSGRSSLWTKAKCRAAQEVVLGGWTTEAGTVRSLLAGVHRDGQLAYVGRIGTGYGAAVAKELLPKLTQLTVDTCPFAGDTAPAKERNVRWLRPDLVAEIEFAGWTATHMIRHAAFKGLRADKPAVDVVAEVAAPVHEITGNARAAAASNAKGEQRASRGAVMGITISKPNKVLWPASGKNKPVTKMDLACYFEAIGAWLLPHVEGRPCSLVRAPDGIKGQQFFQRHAMAGMSDLFAQVKVRGDKQPYVQIDRIEALAAVAQMGALELHPWNCGIGAPEVAGRLVFDLDPAPDVSFGAVIEAALEIRERLIDVGLEAFCKTTGGKGLHVVTPLAAGKGAVPWDQAKNFAHLICAQMAADAPTKYLDTMSKALRTGRIFLDYLRNDRTATAVAVLSPRARNAAPVSMPIDWSAVRKGLDPSRFDVWTAPALLAKSTPWGNYADAARPLRSAMKQLVNGGTTSAAKSNRPMRRARA